MLDLPNLNYYKVVIQPSTEYPEKDTYAIINKETDVVELELSIYLQAVNYAQQMDIDLANHIHGVPEEAEVVEESGVVVDPYQH